MRLLVALASWALCGSAYAAVPCGQEQSLGWGFETWTLGTHNFQITLGDGQNDVTVDSVQGFVSANAHGTTTDPNFQRQSLVTFTYTSPWGYSGSAQPSPDAYSINAVDGNLFGINVKQKGTAGIHMPINIAPKVAVTIPKGVLYALVNNETYGFVGNGEGTVTAPLSESIDIEVHVVVWFTEVCPAPSPAPQVQAETPLLAPLGN